MYDQYVEYKEQLDEILNEAEVLLEQDQEELETFLEAKEKVLNLTALYESNCKEESDESGGSFHILNGDIIEVFEKELVNDCSNNLSLVILFESIVADIEDI